jgi:hypothetical protein
MTNRQTINNVKLGYCPLTDRIMLYRQGKHQGLALERREAESDVMEVLVVCMMHEAPGGSERVVIIGGKQYRISVTPNNMVFDNT